MAIPSIHLSTPQTTLPKLLFPFKNNNKTHNKSNHHLTRQFPSTISLHNFPPKSLRTSTLITSAYVAAPASDPNISDDELQYDESDSGSGNVPPIITSTITWGLVWSLLLRHKLQLAISVATLIGCTTCTLSMPILSGRFFEVIIGSRPDPLWNLLGTVAVLYTLEPIFTIMFVTNLNTIWEKVMTKLRAIVFRRIIIQKVEFFDRYKVGELTGLLTSDLASIKSIVSDNISRDRGFRALSEASNSTLLRCCRDSMHLVCSISPACSNFGNLNDLRISFCRQISCITLYRVNV